MIYSSFTKSIENESVQLFHPHGKKHGTSSILTNADIALE